MDVSEIKTRIGGHRHPSTLVDRHQIDVDYYVGGRAGKREKAAGLQGMDEDSCNSSPKLGYT